MDDSSEFDVIVVGAGNAALCAGTVFGRIAGDSASKAILR